MMSILGMRCAPAAVSPCRSMLLHAHFGGSPSSHGSRQAETAQQLISLRSFRSNSTPHPQPGRQRGQRRRRTAADAAARQPPQQQRRSDSRLPQMDRYFATCHPGLEQAVMSELLSPQIGAAGANIGKAGVYFW